MKQLNQIPMLDLRAEYEYLREEINSAITKCLDHQRWILGPEVEELENKTANYLGAKYCIGVSSGTEALVLSLRAMAIKLRGEEYFNGDDRVITTPFTFTATGDAILRAGATPVFIDIDPGTFNIDTAKIEEYLSKNSGAAVGIIPVHLYGRACDMDRIMTLAERYGLFVVEDVAQAFGGSWKDRRLGAIGTAGAFSFFPSKNLGAYGDGGMVSTNDSETAEIMRMLLKHGGRDKYNVEHIGYNARLDTLQAAVLLAKLVHIDEFNKRRRNIAGSYNLGLQGMNGIILPQIPESPSEHVFHQYTIRVKKGRRAEIQALLKEKGVSSIVYYPVPLHKMKVFEGRCKMGGAELEITEKMTTEVLSLPMGPFQAEEVTMQVIGAVKAFCK